MTALATPPKLQFLDSNGAPLVGGKLYTYAAGTTTPQVTYTDFGGGTANANPVILDSRGEASVWLGTSLYKMALYDSTDVLIWTVDNIGGFATLAQLAASGGSNLIGYLPAGTGAVATTVQTKLRESVSVFDFMTAAQIADVKANTALIDVTTAMQAAINVVKTVGGRVVVPQGTYLISNSLVLADETATYASVQFVGQGAPVIKSNNLSAPIIKIGGLLMRLEGFNLQYTSQPTSGQTDAVAIRTYNLSYSVIQSIYVYQVRNGIDQYQGVVAATGTNTFFSNTISDIVIQRYTGYGVIMIPTSGGNSGSVWSNIYINYNINGIPSGSGVTLGAFWLQTAQNEVIDLLNLEWQRNPGPLLVLNQCGNTSVRGLHIEGVYPTAAYEPLINVIGGDGSCPTFDGITVTGSDWTGLGGANLGALFRLTGASPAKITVLGVQSTNNTNPTYMSAVNTGGATSYGSTIEFVSVYDVDNSLSTSGVPRVSLGTPSATQYPVLRWNNELSSVRSSSGTLTPTISVATTIYTLSQPGLYMFHAYIPTFAAGATSGYSNYAIVSYTGANTAAVIDTGSGSNVVFSIASSTQVQITSAAGGSPSYSWQMMRMA
jgi:hypothetical protein